MLRKYSIAKTFLNWPVSGTYAAGPRIDDVGHSQPHLHIHDPARNLDSDIHQLANIAQYDADQCLFDDVKDKCQIHRDCPLNRDRTKTDDRHKQSQTDLKLIRHAFHREKRSRYEESGQADKYKQQHR